MFLCFWVFSILVQNVVYGIIVFINYVKLNFVSSTGLTALIIYYYVHYSEMTLNLQAIHKQTYQEAQSTRDYCCNKCSTYFLKGHLNWWQYKYTNSDSATSGKYFILYEHSLSWQVNSVNVITWEVKLRGFIFQKRPT